MSATFVTLSPHLQPVANAALRHFTEQYGKAGLQLESSISPVIPWRPTFVLKPAKHHLVAVEVDDAIYPQVLKIAARDLLDAPLPISAYVACPLEAYLADKKQQQVRDLQGHGFGLFTIDSDGGVIKKASCVP